MGGIPTTELKMLTKAATEFARGLLAPERAAHDRYPFGPLFTEALDRAFDLDFFHITLPEKLGGVGLGMQALCAVLERISRVDASMAGVLVAHLAAQELLLAGGTTNFLARCNRNPKTPTDILLAFPAFNSPLEIPPQTVAHKAVDGYVIDGPTDYLVLGEMARFAVVPAVAAQGQELDFFVVELETDHCEKSAPVLSLGLHACAAVDVTFNRATGQLIGNTGTGTVLFARMATHMHLAGAAMASGLMAGAFDAAYAYSRERMQGGRKILHWQEVRTLLADMAFKQKATTMLIEQAAVAMDQNRPGWEKEALTAAIFAHEAACEVTSNGVQVLGGVGYMKDFGQEKRFRDAQHIKALLGLAPLKKIGLFQLIMGKDG